MIEDMAIRLPAGHRINQNEILWLSENKAGNYIFNISFVNWVPWLFALLSAPLMQIMMRYEDSEKGGGHYMVNWTATTILALFPARLLVGVITVSLRPKLNV